MSFLTYCLQLGWKMCEYPSLKLWVGAWVAIFSFFFDTMAHQALYALFVLIIFDTLSGIHAAARQDEHIQSAKMVRTALKIAVYFSLVSAGFMTEKATHVPFIDDTIIGFLATTELISILENTSRAGYAIPMALLKKLKELAKIK